MLSFASLYLSRIHLPALPSLKPVLLADSLAAFFFSPLRYYAGSDSWPSSPWRSGLSAYAALLSEHPAPNHTMRPNVALPVTSARSANSGLRHVWAGSPTHAAESGSSAYGLFFRLRLLSTPPRGGAVTFDYMGCDFPW